MRARLTPSGLGLVVAGPLLGAAGWALGYAELSVLAVACVAAVVLALLAFATLVVMNLLTRRTRAETAV